jgi:hypothetical protein
LLLDIFEVKKIDAVPENYEDDIIKLIVKTIEKEFFSYNILRRTNSEGKQVIFIHFTRLGFSSVGALEYNIFDKLVSLHVTFNTHGRRPDFDIKKVFRLASRFEVTMFLNKINEIFVMLDEVFNKKGRKIGSLMNELEEKSSFIVRRTSKFSLKLTNENSVNYIILVKYPRKSISNLSELLDDDLFYFEVSKTENGVNDPIGEFTEKEIIEMYSGL